MFTKKTIIQKTAQVGRLTAISRILGMAREMLTTRYLGANAFSDVFIAAFSIPNALRKIFAEGALSAAFVPEIVRVVRIGGPASAGGIMTLAFIIFQGMVITLCGLIIWQAEFVMKIRVPGFLPEQILYGSEFLRILAPFIFFLSSSSLLAGALHAVARFGVPAFGPIVLNVAFITSLLLCLWLNLPIQLLCVGILCGGVLLLAMHIVAYLRAEFSFKKVTRADVACIISLMPRFFFSLIAMSTVEVKLFIDSQFASYLAPGTVSLIYYAERFLGIPLGILVTSFATVLLPHLSRVQKQAPQRLNFYLLESFKLVYWVIIPVMFIMGFLAHDIFITLFVSQKFSIASAHHAGTILRVYVLGLFFYAISKILHNFFFSFNATWIPACVSIASAFFNIGLNIVLMRAWQAPGLVMASNIAVGCEMVAMLFILAYWFKMPFALRHFLPFMARSTAHSIAHCTLFVALFYGTSYVLKTLFFAHQHLIFASILFWAWVGPLLCVTALIFVRTRKAMGIHFYFLDE